MERVDAHKVWLENYVQTIRSPHAFFCAYSCHNHKSWISWFHTSGSHSQNELNKFEVYSSHSYNESKSLCLSYFILFNLYVFRFQSPIRCREGIGNKHSTLNFCVVYGNQIYLIWGSTIPTSSMRTNYFELWLIHTLLTANDP